MTSVIISGKNGVVESDDLLLSAVHRTLKELKQTGVLLTAGKETLSCFKKLAYTVEQRP